MIPILRKKDLRASIPEKKVLQHRESYIRGSFNVPIFYMFPIVSNNKVGIINKNKTLNSIYEWYAIYNVLSSPEIKK